MNQKIIIMRLSLVIAVFLLVGLFGVALAQNEILPAKEPLPELPDSGQKPGDFFYFLDQLAEALQEFFTFNPEAKALLQTERALERIAEIRALLEVKGVDAPGLAVAQEKIQAHMAKAARIVEDQKAKGKEITRLAEKLDDDFDARQELLKQTLKVERAKLKAQKEEIKLQILQARQAGDFEKVAQLRATLVEIETQKEALEQKWEAQEELLELEEEKLEAELEVEEKELEELEKQEEDILEQKEEELERAFEQREKALELQEKALEIDLKKAILEGNGALAQQIRAQLSELENQKAALGAEEKAAEKVLEREEKKLEKVRDLKERAEEQIKKAEEEVAELKKEIAKLVKVPEAVSILASEAESKLANAKSALEAEKYGEAYGQAMAAEMLAKNAERKIEQEEELEEKFEEMEKKLEEKEEAGVKPIPINVNLSSHEAYSLLKTIEDVVLVDVREKTERDAEYIDDFGWVPYSHLKADHPEDWAELEGIVKAHNRAIIYCAIGKRSFDIVSKLREKGYSNVYNLAGGIAEWKQKYPVIKAEEIKPEEKIEPEEQKIINITPPLEIEDFYTDKKVYYSNEIMTLTLKINSSSRIENVRIRTYGILDKWGSYRLNIEQKTNLTPGTNVLDFSYNTPSCYGCVGINPGIYELTSLITYGEISVNKTTDIEIKP